MTARLRIKKKLFSALKQHQDLKTKKMKGFSFIVVSLLLCLCVAAENDENGENAVEKDGGDVGEEISVRKNVDKDLLDVFFTFISIVLFFSLQHFGRKRSKIVSRILLLLAVFFLFVCFFFFNVFIDIAKNRANA